MGHTHRIDEASWPFEVPINTAAFTTRPVLEQSLPVLEVYHDQDGDWQFMCGTTSASVDCKLVCLGCMAERDPSILQLANLPPGWMAHRHSSTGVWVREAYQSVSDEA